ncbi:ATP-binding protein [Flavobacterium sp. xlx-214]|uniref:AAA family ATPase n=1 Tax=unclassified Flavobacterium TaxID=196869 RepID=UPI0013D4299F|nr:ATP-binding protein [Flavobacterium sp. xlx-214]MBA5793244.1 ATP-binding protein [Flavobacterium sp. xlx-221]QMI82473.1 ATP-binding protein [Flavobacterium sp. xlx-214]
MDKKIILLIGGPGSGKTTVIEGLANKGYTCYPEISRQVTLEAQKRGVDQLFLKEPLLFSELLLEGRVKQFTDAINDDSALVFLDRGIPDVLAYMHYIGDTYPTAFDDACKKHIYTKIFIMPPWQDIYVSDNERYENFEQAKLIHNHLVETYQNYGYTLFEVPKENLENRIQFILNNI